MIEYYIHRFYAWIIVSAFLIGFAFFRWLYKRKSKASFKNDKIKPKDIVRNLKDDTKATIYKVNSGSELIFKNVVNLPAEYSQKEMMFIDNWYMEEGIKQLKASDKRGCFNIYKHPAYDDYSYVEVNNIPVNVKTRSNTTLETEDKVVFRTVKLLLLNEWIK